MPKGRFGKDLVGKNFGKLTVIERAGKNIYGGLDWNCKCECGKVIRLSTGALNQGHFNTCGCKIGTEFLHQKDFYAPWTTRKTYMCEEWKDFDVFYKYAIENCNGNKFFTRTDDKEPFSPSNIVFCNKNYKQTKGVYISGEFTPLSVIAKEYGLSREIVYKRYNSGLRGEDVVIPPEHWYKNSKFSKKKRKGAKNEEV